MILSQMHVKNYRALRDVTLPLSKFGCIIGENNAGKSSVLTALSLFLTGTSLTKSDHFDPTEDIRIAVDIEGISAEDLNRLEETHRGKLAPYVVNGKLTLARVYSAEGEGKGKLRQVMRVPTDLRFDEGEWKGKMAGKKGEDLRAQAIELFPELSDVLPPKPIQADIKAAISGLIAALPADQLADSDEDLVTGIDKSISPLLPEPLYIPAVKDLGGDIKYKESAPFGKIIKILLNVIEPRLAETKGLFDTLNRNLNGVRDSLGEPIDERYEEVQAIESTIERLLRESFPGVTLRIEIPPPEIKSILEGAKLSVDDGIPSYIETKGDGLKRAVVFSILRAYEEILRRFGDKSNAKAGPQYLLLFEEPELYLHPKAQHVLFRALAAFSRDHHVVVTTHSPVFFSPDDTFTFLKMSKRRDLSISRKAFSEVLPVDLRDLDKRSQFQVICYENNNHAFFAQTVVLVEGQSDELMLGHIARILKPEWDSLMAPVAFARIGGKGSISVYRKFFRLFGVRVIVVADLDILINGFHQVAPTAATSAIHSRLSNHLNGLLHEEIDPEPKAKALNRIKKSGEIRAKWKRALDAYDIWLEKQDSLDDVNDALDEFFGHSYDDFRMAYLQSAENPTTIRLKEELILSLYGQDVFVLHNGALEDYYPEGFPERDKAERAVAYCQTYKDQSAVHQQLKDKCKCFRDGRSELEVLFGVVFGTADLPVIEMSVS